ncbi:hypothetical protein CRE_09125 [Caenorhabditis remanei]|uniref:CYtochrome P450 family n=1 Tax=Caenorhabditis remanei TaxID=31234 RepID=E3LJG2_CAERE|nr:hypothetical protein CRE_09125 [Caenorhabditis remanei]
MIFLILIAVTIIILFNQFRKVKHLPPGPFPLPLIGNIHQLAYQAWRHKGIVAALSYFRRKYGNVYTLWLGPVVTVSITDYEISHEAFVKNGRKCIDRQLSPILKKVSDGHGIQFNNGEEWAELRRFTLLAFRKLGVGNGLEGIVMEELNGRCSELNSEISLNGKAIVTVELFDLTVGSVINTLLVGKRFDENTKSDFLIIKRLFDASAETFNLFDLSVPVWFLKTFLPRRYKMTWESRQNFLSHVSREAEERLERMKTGNYEIDKNDPRDFVDVFLLKMQEEKGKGESGNPSYSIESLKILLYDLWLAGQGTTSTTLYAGFVKLVQHPEVILKIREELAKVTQNARDLSLQDRRNTPYLNATIAEIQRHASILNVNFWRLNHETIDLQGYQIEPGTWISAQLGALHVNEELFENPKKFDPERFLRNEKLLQQIIPFGIGKRSCVGEQIARTELYLVIGNILLRYDVKAHGPCDLEEDEFPFSSAKLPDISGKFEFVKL